MNIIHFTHELPQASGVATFVREVSAALEDIGVESRIVLDPKELPREPEAGTILHIHGMWKPVYHQAAKWAKANGVKIVWSTHGMTAPWSMAHKRWKKLIAWWLYQKRDLKRAALIHSTVEQEAEWNRKLGLGVGGRCSEIIVPLGTYLPQTPSAYAELGETCVPTPLPAAGRHNCVSPSCGTIEAKDEGSPSEGGAVFSGGSRGGASDVRSETIGEPKTLLFVGRIYPVKALDRLIEAFSRAHVPGWQLRLVGPDQSGHTAELIALCKKLNIPYSDDTKSTFRSDQIVDFTSDTIGRNVDMPSGCEADGALGIQVSPNFACAEGTCVQESPRVIFAGPKFGPDLSAEYAACDILALVSHTENFGATVVDALAHGKPVITSTNTPWREVTGCVAEDEGSPSEGGAVFRGGSRGGASDVRSDNSPDATANSPCGWWVDNDVNTLTACLRSALTTPPSTLAEMGARGRFLVESKYTWRAVASRLADAYAEIVG